MGLMRATRPQAAVDAAQLTTLAKKILAVPDKLAAVHLDLRQICNGDTSGVPLEAKRAIGDACDLLHTAIADVSEMAQYVNDWLASNGGPRTVLSDGVPTGDAKPPRSASAPSHYGTPE